jgi:RNA polymerase sigma-70 factor (family 1)
MNTDFNFYWKRIQKGDQFALEQVYKTSYKVLVYYASEITGQPNLAEEIVHDVFIKIWENRSSLLIQGSFKAYLFQSVHNHSLNSVRQQKTKRESVNTGVTEDTWKFISETYDLHENLIEKIFSDETEMIINGIIEDLPDQCRKVFTMSRYDLLKNEEISARLGITEHTVRSHLYKALHRIEMVLKKVM